jgi:pimeloyl-ACP methyl ester carboxylesterase
MEQILGHITPPQPSPASRGGSEQAIAGGDRQAPPLPAPSDRIPLAFAHANSYPAASYAPLFDALAPGFEVHAHPKLGHDPLHPVTDCWPALVREYETWLFSHERQGKENAGEAHAPWLLVGHSLGGFLSLMVAARHPQKVRGVVLLDSPVVGGWQAGLLWFGKRTGLAHRYSPARFAIKRRDRFENLEDAFMHFRGKGVFAEFSDAALRTYLRAGLASAKDGKDHLKLAFDRRIEAHIYATLPHNMIATVRKLRRAAPKLPVAFVGGSRSQEVKQVGLRYTRWLVPGQHMRTVEGTHLFPLEQPAETARAITELAEAMQR